MGHDICLQKVFLLVIISSLKPLSTHCGHCTGLPSSYTTGIRHIESNIKFCQSLRMPITIKDILQRIPVEFGRLQCRIYYLSIQKKATTPGDIMADIPSHHLVYGFLKDFITGEVVPDTDDERYRQKIARMLVEVIRYGPGSLVTRQRSAIAAARVLNPEYCIPIAVVTNGQDAEILDTWTGKVIARGLEAIYSKKEAGNLIKNLKSDAVTPPVLSFCAINADQKDIKEVNVLWNSSKTSMRFSWTR